MTVRSQARHGHHERFSRLLQRADLLTPWAVRAASTLGLAEAIAAGASTSAEIAAAISPDPRAVRTLLRYLVPHEVFAECGPDQFQLGPLGEVLAADLRFPLRTMLDSGGMQSRFGQAAAGLAAAVRTGRAAYPEVFGHSFWADMTRFPALGQAFDELMALSAAHWAPELVAGWDWGAVRHVVDVGGGTGDLLIALLSAHPWLTGTLVEQDAVASRAERKLAGSGLNGRVRVWPGSFFDPLPAGGDVYVLAQILHDWPDAEAAAILRRCRDAAGSSGHVLLAERVVTDEPSQTAKIDMDMLMLVLFGSSERSEDQFRTLAGVAGLRLTGQRSLGIDMSLLECVSGEDPAANPAPDARQAAPASLRPARKAAEASRPPAWRTGPPDFVGVGVPQAGADWLARLIAAHPGTTGTCPELRYFEHSWHRDFGADDISGYQQHFSRPDDCIAGEWTPQYLCDGWVLPRLSQAAPAARLLALLRDPLARFAAELGARRAQQLTLPSRVLTEVAGRSRYAAMLAELTRYFAKDQVLVLQLERCLADPAGQLARVYQFLGLDESFVSDDLSGTGLSDPEPAALPADIREFLTAQYKDDSRELVASWPEIDLSLWPTVQ